MVALEPVALLPEFLDHKSMVVEAEVVVVVPALPRSLAYSLAYLLDV